ncbi:ATP-binding cassette domain-containing protein [Candidatus Similichlamydia epinepheli]|uniref:ATP-binding cassette domain-containing protein n=1 Tax=Candidatus Similichlamydia epinepheli TaxID=1903953 RepID=UPI000D36DF6A|nr:ATP-binding cassette domain-containing protein [Candidatus Similichlamydia epinepheli]
MIFLEAYNLSYSYQGKKILKDVFFSCSSGERVSIIGSSGAGKSCFLSLLCGLIKPSSGQVICRGSEIVKLRDRSIIGYIPQEDIFLGFDSALYNALLSLELKKRSESAKYEGFVREMLAFLEISPDARPYELSGGEKRRLSIIRALATRPIILVADEWAAGLDPSNQAKVCSLFEECSSVIFVSHDPKNIWRCHRTYQMEQGHLLPI